MTWMKLSSLHKGLSIKEIVEIDIPYPRDQETKMSPRFLELKNHIWSQVYKEYLEVKK